MTSESDCLLERLRREGEPALAEVFSGHRARLERLVRFRMDPRLSARVDVADVLQEAFLDSAKRLGHYLAKPEAPLFVWLRGITLNTLMDCHRRHLGASLRDAAKDVSLFGAVSGSSELLAAQLVGPLTSPSRAAMRQEAAILIESALQQMDPTDREVLAMRHFEQLSNQEVADALGLSKTAASNRYVRALARLRELLQAIPGLMDSQG